MGNARNFKVRPRPHQIQACKNCPKALIVIGSGMEEMKRGVRYSSDKYLDQAALASFGPFTKNHDVTIKHVRSASQMTRQIESDTWDVVVYFGHGVVTEMALAPAKSGPTLDKDELVKSLAKAQPKQVYLFGCRAAWTGLARQLSKELSGATIHGFSSEVEGLWEQRKEPGKPLVNELRFNGRPAEYTNGLQTDGGKKTKKRLAERLEPYELSDDPLGVPMVDQ